MIVELSVKLEMPSPDPQAQVVSAVRAARFALNWSQADLASTSGVSEVSIARLESGALSPRLSTLSKIQHALEVAGVSITLNQPPGGYTLALTPDAVATSRRRYDLKAPKAGHEQDGSATGRTTAKAGRQQDTPDPSNLP